MQIPPIQVVRLHAGHHGRVELIELDHGQHLAVTQERITTGQEVAVDQIARFIQRIEIECGEVQIVAGQFLPIQAHAGDVGQPFEDRLPWLAHEIETYLALRIRTYLQLLRIRRLRRLGRPLDRLGPFLFLLFLLLFVGPLGPLLAGLRLLRPRLAPFFPRAAHAIVAHPLPFFPGRYRPLKPRANALFSLMGGGAGGAACDGLFLFFGAQRGYCHNPHQHTTDHHPRPNLCHRQPIGATQPLETGRHDRARTPESSDRQTALPPPSTRRHAHNRFPRRNRRPARDPESYTSPLVHHSRPDDQGNNLAPEIPNTEGGDDGRSGSPPAGPASSGGSHLQPHELERSGQAAMRAPGHLDDPGQ